MPVRPVRLLLLSALVLRLALPALAYVLTRDTSLFIVPDSLQYLELARSLVSDGRFVRDGAAELFRTPGYPLLVGIGTAVGHPLLVTLLLQAAIGTVTVWLTMRIAWMMRGDTRIALICGWLCAIEPVQLAWGARLVADPLLAMAIAAAVWALLAYVRKPTVGGAARVALLLAGAAFVKPIGYYLSIVWFAVVAVEWLRDAIAPVRPLRHAAAFVLVLAATLGAWQVRNGLTAGFWGFSTIAARAVYFNLGNTTAGGGGDGATRAGGNGDSASGVDAMYAMAWQELRSAPLAFAASHARGVLRTTLDPANLEYLRLFGLYPKEGFMARAVGQQGLLRTARIIVVEQPVIFWTTVAFGGLVLTYLVLAARGLWRAREARTIDHHLLLATALFFLVLAGGALGTNRLRAAAMPSIILLGAWAFTPIGTVPRPGALNP